MQASMLKGGFVDAATDAAGAFRAAMNAMARPGRIEAISGAVPPAALSMAAGTLILTLCDPDTPLFLSGRCDTAEVREWITFHTGAPLVPAGKAKFAVGEWAALVPLSQYCIGTPEYPDRSATLIVEMDDLTGSGSTLSGPGIRETARLSLPGESPFRDNTALFPLGLDFFFTCGARVAALPRTTKVG